MSLMVSNIRLPFDVPEEQALAEARRLTSRVLHETMRRGAVDSVCSRLFNLSDTVLCRVLRSVTYC